MDDDHLRELLRSPLDDASAGRGRGRRLWWVGGGLAIVAVAIILSQILGGGRDGWFGYVPGTAAPSSPEPSPGPVAAPASTLPGLPGEPASGSYHQLVFDPVTERVILTEGLAMRSSSFSRTGAPVTGTWAYEAGATTWLEYPSAPTPARAGYAAAYHAGSGRVVLFGGGTRAFRPCGESGPCGAAALGDTWLLDPVTAEWEMASPVMAPSPRYGAAMAHDENSGRLILFGGGTTTPRAIRNEALGDTWAYDVAADTWTELSPGGDEPPPRAWHRMVYDPTSDRVLMFGGSGSGDLDARVWSYDADANRWEASDASGPSARWTPIAAFDTASGVMIIAGGQGPEVRTVGEGVTATELRWHDDVWSYSPSADAWTELTPIGGGIPWASGAYHPGVDRVVAQLFDSTGLLDADTGEWTWIEPERE